MGFDVIQDLNEYMRGVSIPTHEHARIAHAYLQSLSVADMADDVRALGQAIEQLTASARAYTRVVLRLRAQAESELHPRPQPEVASRPPSAGRGAVNGHGPASTPPLSWNNASGSTRAPSPAQSLYSQGPGRNMSLMTARSVPPSPASIAGSVSGSANGNATNNGFRSPLFRVGRAPLLRVFVPSPEGDWLSDNSVLRCEAELREAGVLGLMRAGDVVWDIAVGDEGNVGRMVWDGSYLIVSQLCATFRRDSLTRDSGPGLHVLDCGRHSEIRACSGVPTVVFPQGHSNGAYERESCRTHRYQPVG